MDLSSEESRDLAADGEAESRPPVLAARAAVGLLEGLEDDELLVAGNPDARVVHREREHGVGPPEAVAEPARAALGLADGQGDPSLPGELERVRQQVLDHLLQALGVGQHGPGRRGIEVDRELEALRLRDVAEGAFHVVVQVGEPELADVHGHRARLDLREVEDVVDEEEKVRPRRVDGLGELRLPAREIAVGILGKLVRQDEEAVERRAQLVRHVGEKLGLVLRGEGELLGFLLESFASLLHLLVLALHLHVLVGEEAGLFLQLLVGVLELFLPAL